MTLSSEARFPLKIDWERVMNLPEWQRGGSLAAVEPPLICFPLRGEWEANQPIKINEYPAPEYTSRDGIPLPQELPRAVIKLAQFAQERRWGVIAQSSMGSVPHARTGRPSGLKRLAALRFGAHPSGRRAYVVYEAPAKAETWKPRSIMIWGPDLPPYAHVGSNGLKVYLADQANRPTAELKAWVAEIERLRVASEAFQKRRMTVRRQIIKIADEGRFRAGQAESRQEYDLAESEWLGKIADLQDGVFTSDEVAVMIDPARRRRATKEGL